MSVVYYILALEKIYRRKLDEAIKLLKCSYGYVLTGGDMLGLSKRIKEFVNGNTKGGIE